MIKSFSDHSSNERTFLSWVRTSMSIVGFGIASARLGNMPVHVWSEVLMLATGAVVIFLAFLRMRHVRARIAASEPFDDDAVPADGLLLLLIAALFALLATFVVHVG